jgi:hypothetical protein
VDGRDDEDAGYFLKRTDPGGALISETWHPTGTCSLDSKIKAALLCPQVARTLNDCVEVLFVEGAIEGLPVGSGDGLVEEGVVGVSIEGLGAGVELGNGSGVVGVVEGVAEGAA